MSGIAGIFNLDGRPVDRDVLRRMTDAAAHRGRDGSGYWSAGPVGLGHRMFHTTPESLQEQQPLTDETDSLCLTFDGRVDNRDELKTALESAGHRLRTDTDAEIVLHAYERWGEQCARKIIGDFAFVIWDERLKQLYCARDFMGIRPFYYYTNGRVFLFSSELHQLFENSETPRQANEGMIGEFLCANLWTREETLWQGVLRLPAAHYLIVQANGVRLLRYWDVNPDYEIRYRRDEEYAEHFLGIFREAVRCRMRSYGPVASDLSGGMDSSSVVSMVQVLARSGEVDAAGFRTFSWVFPGLECDESQFIDDVVDRWGLDSHTWFPKIRDVSFFAERAACYQDFPGYPNSSMLSAYRAQMREQGYRVVLSGEGGDEWLTGGLGYYGEILFYSGLLPALREAYSLNQLVDQLKELPISSLKFHLRPYISEKLLKRFRKYRPPEIPPWLSPDFVRRIQLKERLQQTVFSNPLSDRSFSNIGKISLYYCLRSAWAAHTYETIDRDCMGVGIEVRHPFEDRRIVEFGMSLPHLQRQRGKKTKVVLRQAMQGLLPESVRHRLDKPHFNHFFADALRRYGVDYYFSLPPSSQGWISRTEVQRMYHKFENNYAEVSLRYPIYIWALWMICGVGVWWNAVNNQKE